MSLFSQIAIILMIVLTIVILIYSNKKLADAEKEGEHFVDEWAMRQREQEKKEDEESISENPLEWEEEETEFVELSRPITLAMLDEGQRVVRTIPVATVPFTIGRGEENDLVLQDLTVACHHAKIVEEQGNLILKDLGTANQIYSNGQVVPQCVLKNQIRFYLGNYEFVVREEANRSAPTTLSQGSGAR